MLLKTFHAVLRSEPVSAFPQMQHRFLHRYTFCENVLIYFFIPVGILIFVLTN